MLQKSVGKKLEKESNKTLDHSFLQLSEVFFNGSLNFTKYKLSSCCNIQGVRQASMASFVNHDVIYHSYLCRNSQDGSFNMTTSNISESSRSLLPLFSSMMFSRHVHMQLLNSVYISSLWLSCTRTSESPRSNLIFGIK